MPSSPSAAVPPPDVGWAWVVMVASFFNCSTVFGVLKSGGVMYMAIMESLRLSRTEAALIPSLAFSISCFLGPVSTSLSVHFGVKWVVFIGGLLASFGMALAAAFATSMSAVLVCYGVVVGLGCGLTIVPNIVFVHTYFEKHRSFASSFAIAGGSVGCFIVPPLIEFVVDEFGIRAAFLALAAILLHVCPSALLFRPRVVATRTNKNHQRTTTTDVNGKPTPAEEKSDEKTLFLGNSEAAEQPRARDGLSCCQNCLAVVNIDASIFREKNFYLVAYSMMSFVFVWSGYLTLLPDFAHSEAAEPVTRSMAAFLLSAMSAGDVVFRVVFGWVSDRGWIARRHYFLIFFAITGLVLTCYSLNLTYGGLLANSVVFGVFVSGVIILPPVLLNDFLGPKRFPMAYAICSFINGFVMISSAPILAYVRDIHGSYKPCFLIMGFVMLAVAATWLVNEIVTQRKLRRHINSTTANVMNDSVVVEKGTSTKQKHNDDQI